MKNSDIQIPEWAIQVASAILYTVKLKDAYTFGHCCRVGRQSRRLAKAMGLDEQQQSVLEFSGLFHDIGKVGVSENILLKPSRLNGQEMEIIKKHPQMSADVIKQFSQEPFFQLLLPGIESHHEKIDGSGYPCSLEGNEIPLSARIIAVVDAVDAMTHTRTYRKALSFDRARQELVEFSNIQFDKHIVQVYLQAQKFWKSQEVDSTEKVIREIWRAA